MPERQHWHARLHFDMGKIGQPATDLEGGVQTRVTFWEKDIPESIQLGACDRDGYFSAAFSDEVTG